MKEPGDPRRHFADEVRRLQAERGLSEKELGARAKLDPGELKAILRAENRVEVDVIFLLAGALEVEPGDLLKGIAWVPDGTEYRVEGRRGD